MALTELEVKKKKATDKPQKLSDGGGLFLLIQPNSGKYWRMAYRFTGKQKTLALGVYPDVSLADARARREDARKLLANDIDPGAVKKETKRAIHAATANSFETLAREYHKMKAPMWTAGHAKQWLGNMDAYAFPMIGVIEIGKIEPVDIIGILRGMEQAKTFETRDRLGQSMGAVFKYAIALGLAKHNPAAEIRMALADRPKVEHFACIAPTGIPDFLRALSALSAYEERGESFPDFHICPSSNDAGSDPHQRGALFQVGRL
ncbi:MAG: integrase arm-type DNA-binding domain-containing protein [Gallionella sp.]|nr:integrase arm-type DNA-binding domain-containing protein [Gallionella sp.]